jgi:hypothetical protein
MMVLMLIHNSGAKYNSMKLTSPNGRLYLLNLFLNLHNFWHMTFKP